MLDLFRNKLMQGLIALAIVVGIAGEGTLFYTNVMRARVQLENAKNAPELKRAEADKTAAEAKAAALNLELIEAQTARTHAEAIVKEQEALNAAKLRAAGARLKAAQAATAEIQMKGAAYSSELLKEHTEHPGELGRNATEDGLRALEDH